jgi:uncharacterized membrane protein
MEESPEEREAANWQVAYRETIRDLDSQYPLAPATGPDLTGTSRATAAPTERDRARRFNRARFAMLLLFLALIVLIGVLIV